MTAASAEKPLAPVEDPQLSRQHRVGRYKVWLLQKRLAELSAQVEASVLEARQLISWKHSYQPLTIAELTDEDKRILEHNRRIRLAEVVQRHCSGALKAISQHKWAFPFNNPVDTNRFPDYPKVISTPMDFSTIKARLDSGFYRDPKDWWSDVMLVFSNAKRYNAPGSDCHLMAQTLQEVSEEKYDKVIAPRLAEESATALREEMFSRKKRAELVNLQVNEAMDAQCAVLFNLMAELHAAIREAKSLASSLCEPLTLGEKQALAATIQRLPTAQLESIVAFVASRHPPSVSISEPPPGAAGAGGAAGGGGAPSRKVQLNLGRYNPLLLRQLQHLVSTCTAATRQQQQHQLSSSDSPPSAYLHLQPPQRPVAAPGPGPASPPLPAGATAAVALRGPATASPSPSPGPGAAQLAAASGAAMVSGAVSPDSRESPQQEQPQGSGADTAQPGDLETAAAGAQQQQQPDAGAASAAATAPAPRAPPPPPPAPVGSTQRNISDVVSNPTASGISQRAGIRWPGLAVGAGVRPRARALLSLHLDGPASAVEMLAACPLPHPVPTPQVPAQQPPKQPQQAPQPAAGRLTGVKRSAAQALGPEADG